MNIIFNTLHYTLNKNVIPVIGLIERNIWYLINDAEFIRKFHLMNHYHTTHHLLLALETKQF